MIRLQRIGRKKIPFYRLIINEKGRDTQAKSLEILGTYNPLATPKILLVKADRINHWISLGAKLSNTVHNLLLKEGIITGDKAKSVSLTKKRRTKIEAIKAKEEESKKVVEEVKVA